MRLFIIIISAFCLAPGVSFADTLQPFSTMTSLTDGWEPLEFPDIDQHTDYQLITVDSSQVVRAKTSGGASGLIARLHIKPDKSLLLRWRWKVSNVFQKGDARKKSGDDYPARIYVAFKFEPDKAGFFERARRAALETLAGEELPGNALNYIWANRLERDQIVPNPYVDSTQMIAVASGDQKVGEWVTVTRDIVADYRRAFGEAPPAIVGIAIMSDSDNTGDSATAWYGDIRILSDSDNMSSRQ